MEDSVLLFVPFSINWKPDYFSVAEHWVTFPGNLPHTCPAQLLHRSGKSHLDATHFLVTSRQPNGLSIHVALGFSAVLNQWCHLKWSQSLHLAPLFTCLQLIGSGRLSLCHRRTTTRSSSRRWLCRSAASLAAKATMCFWEHSAAAQVRGQLPLIMRRRATQQD